MIGIDCYLDNKLPDGNYYPSLGGSVRDIQHVEDLLICKIGISRENILKLTSSNNININGEPSEPRDQWPAYENMIDGFEKITEAAKHGDSQESHDGLNHLLSEESKIFLELVAENSDQLQYQIAVNEREEYKIGNLLAKLYQT